VWSAAEVTLPAVEVTLPAVEVMVLVTALTGPVVAEVTGVAAVAVAGAAVSTTPVVPLTTPESVETAEPSTPPVELWGAALAGLASSRPIPNATHRPPTTAPQVYKNTFRASWHQPFMRVTLIHSER